ncbi:MAG: YkgJ family cysteine cluster protein [Planctomycetaceae bacterium]|nr:MAG: YkgJ family cysteine cluster protein [Planctomycetaceae bacterium]
MSHYAVSSTELAPVTSFRKNSHTRSGVFRYNPVMNNFSSKHPWYSAGLAFECAECGRCCAGPEEGYVWVDDAEITQIAAFLGVSPEEFRRTNLRRVGGRYTIVEQKPSNDCSFLKLCADGNKRCAIYPIRPSQCRTWPFWAMNLADPESWAEAGRRCAGINCGKLFELNEIQARLKTGTP